jgi:hypothetical protein
VGVRERERERREGKRDTHVETCFGYIVAVGSMAAIERLNASAQFWWKSVPA